MTYRLTQTALPDKIVSSGGDMFDLIVVEIPRIVWWIIEFVRIVCPGVIVVILLIALASFFRYKESIDGK
jgi:hypothetical protein